MPHERTPQPFTLEDALDAEDARVAGQACSRNHRGAIEFLQECIEDAAEKSESYRKKLADSFLHAEGDTAAAREADAKKRSAAAEHERDIAQGMVKVAQEKVRAVEGERATLHRLIEWSKDLDPTVAEVWAQRMEQKR